MSIKDILVARRLGGSGGGSDDKVYTITITATVQNAVFMYEDEQGTLTKVTLTKDEPKTITTHNGTFIINTYSTIKVSGITGGKSISSSIYYTGSDYYGYNYTTYLIRCEEDTVTVQVGY